MLSLTLLPIWLSAFILVVIPTAIAMAGPVLTRRYVTLDRLRTNNEVAGFKFATVGVIYAVLLAFAIIIVWEKFNDADSDVAKEAGAAVTIYRLSNAAGSAAEGAALRAAMTDYLKAAIARDWPAMESGHASREATEALNKLYATALATRVDNDAAKIVNAEIFRQLDRLTEARRARLVAASGTVPGVVWMVLLGGALLTVGFTFFFGSANLRAQMLMTGALSLLIFAGLLTVVAINQPFAGAVKVTPEALTVALEDFGGR
jgi:hypothetical protein